MTYLFFIASFNAFFFLALLLHKRSKLLHDRILIFWLLYMGIATAAHALTIDFFPNAPLLSSGIIALFLLHGPFLYLYVSALTSGRRNLNTKYIWHFVPFVSFIVYLLIASKFLSYSEGIRVDHVSSGAETPLLFLFFLIITAISGPVYFFVAYKMFRKSKNSAHQSSKEINLVWLGKLIPIFGIVWTALIVISIIHHLFHLFSMAFCTNGLFLSLSVFIILIGFLGLKQKEVFINFSSEERTEIITENKTKYGTSRLEGTELQKCYDHISRYMEIKKPYLDTDLSLPKLADSLNVPPHHLSQVINEMHGSDFSDFINHFRVDEVKRKIQDENFKNYSLLGIALESGFNSKSAFNRVFKNLTGITPSEFRDSLPSA